MSGAASVVHDLNNLLAVILAAAESLQGRPGMDAGSLQDLAAIQGGAARAMDLAARLRGNAAFPRPRLLAIDQAIQALAPLLPPLLGPRVRLDLSPGAPAATALIDPADLDRAVVNLVANAGHAMGQDGVLTLRTSCPADSGEVRIEIADTGPGIAPALLPSIFEPGFTTRASSGGLGLGLAAVRELVQIAGGRLEVESAPGHGACFRLSLRRHLPARVAERPTALLVEDEVTILRLAGLALARAGWQVLAAESGEAALALAATHRPDVLIADLTLPDMDGFALARRLRRSWPDLAVLFTSGYADAQIAACVASCHAAFIAKPFALAALVAQAEMLATGSLTGPEQEQQPLSQS